MELKEVLDVLDPKFKEQKEAIAEQVKAIDTKTAEAIADQRAAIEQVKETVNDIKAKGTGITLKGGQLGFAGELTEKLTANSAKLTGYKNDKKGFSIEMESKAVGNMGSSASITGSYFVPPTVVPGVNLKMFETVHMRDLLPTGSTNSNVVRFVVDNGGEGGPTMVAEAGTKPQIDRDLEIKDANVRKIATYFRVPEEMIEDISYLSSFLSQVGVEEVMVIEDNQILYGDGTGQNLSGFNTLGTAFAAGTSVIATPNNFDVIGAAKKQLRVAKFGGPLTALVNPIDYYAMLYKKDTATNYLFQANQGVTPLKIDGVSIYEHTGVTSGDFFVFSPRAAAIFDRAGTTVRFYDQDQDNAIKNLITIVIEKRLALPIYYPTAIIRGTFATAITDLTS